MGIHQGASIQNLTSEATISAPSHLHTQGAHDLAVGGTRMLAIAGSNEILFEDCATGTVERN
jgi:hypothetical protein